jgi:hypothetical protein
MEENVMSHTETLGQTKLETEVREIFEADISANERVERLVILLNSSPLGYKAVNRAIISNRFHFGSDDDDIIIIWGLRVSCPQSDKIPEQCNENCGNCSKCDKGAKNIVQIGEMSGIDELFEERGGADF